ncbi:hypothetical protein CFOL_v3_00446 [Cephalotus follicularis]|uniref:RVP_2 domain-containing protein n=1 Tax=Cephalotus follicularis TaxID=3775 RepID=A0A1Q3AMC3_CEPFO|nr:hypothetical protein CFOL_v3_00446 [Cephalotus follicularis]
MEVPYHDHRCPPFLEAQINEVFVRRVLIDIGILVNLIPLQVLTVVGIARHSITQSDTPIIGFSNIAIPTIGYIQMDLKVGPVRSSTVFYAMDVNVSYDILLGHPWLNKHRPIPSTYHQCVNGRIGNIVIRILGNQFPFDILSFMMILLPLARMLFLDQSVLLCCNGKK